MSHEQANTSGFGPQELQRAIEDIDVLKAKLDDRAEQLAQWFIDRRVPPKEILIPGNEHQLPTVATRGWIVDHSLQKGDQLSCVMVTDDPEQRIVWHKDLVGYYEYDMKGLNLDRFVATQYKEPWGFPSGWRATGLPPEDLHSAQSHFTNMLRFIDDFVRVHRVPLGAVPDHTEMSLEPIRERPEEPGRLTRFLQRLQGDPPLKRPPSGREGVRGIGAVGLVLAAERNRDDANY